MMGATCLTLAEPIADRRELGLRFGAEHVIDPTAVDVRKAAMELTNGRGYDVVIACSGSTKAVYDLPVITAFGGTLVYAAMYPNTYEMPLNLYKFLYANELTLTGMYVSPYTFPARGRFSRNSGSRNSPRRFSPSTRPRKPQAQVSGKHIKILIECNKFE
jgi:(R,R)-butanediol dehydrogenase/meso-butanediol dehydrogenase/diacetyl reductase/L-iditol 2-dehydrogenase